MGYLETKIRNFESKMGNFKIQMLFSKKRFGSFQLKYGNQNESLEKIIVPINFITNIFNEI